MQLQGGPVPNADNVFMYMNPDTAMADKETSKAASGRIQFVFKVKVGVISVMSQCSCKVDQYLMLTMYSCI